LIELQYLSRLPIIKILSRIKKFNNILIRTIKTHADIHNRYMFSRLNKEKENENKSSNHRKAKMIFCFFLYAT
jgi:hypothetical protein